MAASNHSTNIVTKNSQSYCFDHGLNYQILKRRSISGRFAIIPGLQTNFELLDLINGKVRDLALQSHGVRFIL